MSSFTKQFSRRFRPIFRRFQPPPTPGQDTESDVFDAYLLPQHRTNQASIIFLAILIGILGAYGAILFRYLIQFVHISFFGSDGYTLGSLLELPWWRRLLLPTSGALLVGLIVTRWASEAKGSGIPEVIQAVARQGGMIRFRVLVTKAIAAAVTIGSGGSAGREGPIVHIGSAIGSEVGQVIGAPARYLRTFVACGTAAGIAATFNAPIAGALFSLEVIVGEMTLVNMPPIVISSVIATVVSRHYLGDFPAFKVPAYDLVSPMELFLYAGLGVLAGIVSILFHDVFLKSTDWFEKLKAPAWLKPAMGGLGVGAISLFMPHVFGVGYETINGALWGDLAATTLVCVLFTKLVATALTLGSGGSGGIFAPSLVLGATLGAAWGQAVNHFFPEWTAASGAYALVGMGAVVSAVTHAPISAILVVFELTNNYLTVPPLMLSCMISVVISTLFRRRSIYLSTLERRGIRLFGRGEINLLKSVRVDTVMDARPVLVHHATQFSQLLTVLLSGKHASAIVVSDRDAYLGTVELNDLREVLPQSDTLASLVIAEDIANTAIPCVFPGDNLDLVMRVFGRTGREEIAVCSDPASKRVIGVVNKNTVINAYNIRIFQEDLAGGFSSMMVTAGQGRPIEALGGMHLAQIDIRSSWVGKTLQEADLRRKHSIEVVLILRTDDPEQTVDSKRTPGIFPSPDARLKAGDKLLVLARPEVLRRIPQ